MDDATLAAIRERDAGWSPRCQRAGCTGPEHDYTHWPSVSYHHPFQYDHAADTSPEADRRALLAELDRLRGECEEDGDGR